jgi:hypothetical protein
LMVPILLAVVEATVLARVLGAPSIYSARISAGEGAGAAARERDGAPKDAQDVAEGLDGEFAEVVPRAPRW